MIVDVFDVEHGQCSLITTSTGGKVLIDCGHNSSSGWRPSDHLLSQGIYYIDELVVTNFDEDHVSDLVNLEQAIDIGILTRNPTVPGPDLRRLKSNHGIGAGINTLCYMMGRYTHPVTNQDRTETVRGRGYYNSYPGEFVDENNLSYVYIADVGTLTFCFTGDMTRAGWLKLLQQPSFVAELNGIDVFMASHHGRDDGRCNELFQAGLSPLLTVISDGGIQYASQETVAWYRQRTLGVNYMGNPRRVFTTRRDGTLTFNLSNSPWTLDTTA